MSKVIKVDPVTRIEGHLAIKVETDEGKVTQAYCSGEMFRGFEVLLKGRDPLDAQQITQRICGVCPVEHGMASVLAQDMAYGIQPPANGRRIRNIIHAANHIQSAILHFYGLCAVDFVDLTAILSYGGNDTGLCDLRDWVKSEVNSGSTIPAAPFLPRAEAAYLTDQDTNIGALKHYLEAFDMRALAHRLGAIFAGKMPHPSTIVPGGVCQRVTADKIASCRELLRTLRTFIDKAYIPDVMAVARAFPEYFQLGKGCGTFLSYGVYPESDDGKEKLFPSGVVRDGRLLPFDVQGITESVASSRFTSPTGLRPAAGETAPAPGKPGAYSWLKAPRYEGGPAEVGPLSRLLVSYLAGRETVKSLVDGALASLGRKPEDLASVMGRHAARAIDCKIAADRCAEWVDQLVPDQPVSTDFAIPVSGQGMGLTEAARGALGHWIEIKDRKIHRYQCVVPTTWNCSPRDEKGVPGPIEQALVGTPVADPEHPIEAARVVRSFDPCLACAVH